MRGWYRSVEQWRRARREDKKWMGRERWVELVQSITIFVARRRIELN